MKPNTVPVSVGTMINWLTNGQYREQCWDYTNQKNSFEADKATFKFILQLRVNSSIKGLSMR